MGDIIRVEENEAIPADFIILKSSDSSGISYVDTASLDGEFNLKQKFACKELIDFDLNNFKANIVCDKPNKDLHAFRGTL